MKYKQIVKISLQFEVDASSKKALTAAIATINRELPDSFFDDNCDDLGSSTVLFVKPKRKIWFIGLR